jgi:hypothetical protein
MNHKIGTIAINKDTQIRYIAVNEEREDSCIGCDFRQPDMKAMCFKWNHCEGIVFKKMITPETK